MKIIGQRRHGQRKKARSHATSRERGSVLTEFVMVAPMMLLIAGSALRFYQELQAKEIGITYAREAATLAYNKCVDITRFKVIQTGTTTQDTLSIDQTETENAIKSCLTEVQTKFNAAWSFAKPIAGADTITITLAVRRCKITEVLPATCPPADVRELKIGSGGLLETQPSAFRNRLVVARISFDTAPLATFIPTITSRSIDYDAIV